MLLYVAKFCILYFVVVFNFTLLVTKKTKNIKVKHLKTLFEIRKNDV